MEELRQKNVTLDTLLKGTKRLLATYEKNPENPVNKKHPENSDAVPAPEAVTGYGVMTFVDCLEDAVPGIRKSYDDMSLYLHGDFFANMFTAKVTRLYMMKEGVNVTIKKHNKIIESLREWAFCDFQLLLDLSLPLRARWDASNTA